MTFLRAYTVPLLLLLLLAGCTEPAPQGEVVARVNTTVLTTEMVRESAGPGRVLTDDEVRQYANRWITSQLLYEEAKARGYDETEGIRRKVEEARRQLAVAELLEREVYAAAEGSVSTTDVAMYYQQHTDEYLLKEDLVRLSVIIFRSSDAATRFRASALGGTGWDESVSRVRADPDAGVLSHSDSLFFTPASLYPPELWKVASILGMFEVSFPVNTSAGYVVMRSLGQYKKGSLSPIQYIADDIRHRLAMERRQQRYAEFLQGVRRKHTVQYQYSTPDTSGLGVQ
ncbi:MAG: hypothetical protein F9K22_09480 [Bacteroidetes bacterium]|nr:MAG: hypothetical protein F9K22_09480 [Bacteroidota bacterium]